METPASNAQSRRVIKRYSNRKLYDTRDSRYVTLLQIAEMVRSGEDVQIIDNTTKEDKTEVTLALAISEELKTKPRSVPLGTLRTLIQQRGEKLLTSLRDGPIGRLIPTGPLGEGGEQKDATAEQGASADAASTATPGPETPSSPPKHDPWMSLSDLVASSRHTIDQWQHAIDDRIRAVLPGFSLFSDIQTEVRKLSMRVQELEKRVEQMQRQEPSGEEKVGDGTQNNPPGE